MSDVTSLEGERERSMLSILLNIIQPNKTGHPRTAEKGAKKRDENSRGSKPGAEPDLPQPQTPCQMRLRHYGVEVERENLLNQQRDHGIPLPNPRQSRREVLSEERQVSEPDGKEAIRWFLGRS
jgi:hypothetical protein